MVPPIPMDTSTMSREQRLLKVVKELVETEREHVKVREEEEEEKEEVEEDDQEISSMFFF